MTIKQFKKEFNSYLNVEQIEQLLKNNYYDLLSNKAKNNLNQILLPLKIGNKKIGNDTVIFNTNSVFNCYCKHHNLCGLNCYAKNYTNMYKNSFINSLVSEVNFNKLTVNQIINQIETFILKHKSKKINFIRINEQGDIKNNKELNKLETISKYFYKKHNIIAYTYTHNKNLNLDLCDYLVVNTSEFKKDNNKQVIILKDYNKLNKIVKNFMYNYNFCLGNCYNCSYCKDKNNKLTTIFLQHDSNNTIEKIFNKYVDVNLLEQLKLNVLIDNTKFIETNF